VTWGDSSNIQLTLPQSLVTLWVKDSCGNTASSVQTIYREDAGYIKELQERIECSWQEIYPVYFGFNAPNVCLYKWPQNTLVECKQAPTNYNGGALTNFFHLPFGQDYYVIVQDGCHRDSAFFKDKTSAGGVELNPYNWKCNTFDLHVDGNNSGVVCLYNSLTDSLISCKPTNNTAINPKTGLPWPYGGAEWLDLPYGTYYSFIYDPCADTLIRIDTTVIYPRKFETILYNDCQISQTGIGSYFNYSTPFPQTTYVYWPNDSLVKTNYSTFAGSPQTYFTYPTYPFPGVIKVVQEDGCGNRDTSYLNQAQIYPIRTLEAKGICPGIIGSSGGGDIVLSGNKIAYGGSVQATVSIVKIDSVTVTIPQTYTQWNAVTNKQEYFFTNLTTGLYVFESTVGCYGFKVYDTINVRPYLYPLQEQTHILQCGSNPYLFKDTITGGMVPFTYEIIALNPSNPSLMTGPQISNVFSIPPGTDLSSITIQVIDACGNSNTRVFPVTQSNCYPLLVDNVANKVYPKDKSIKIYPNPSNRMFTIAFSAKKKTDYQMDIYTAAGVKIHTSIYISIDEKRILIDENLKPGTYIITIIDLKKNSKYYYKQMIF
jgi:hypothetical protein